MAMRVDGLAGLMARLSRRRTRAARSTAERETRVIGTLLATVAGLLGLLGLLAWFWRPGVVRAASADEAPFTANAAICVVLVAASLVIGRRVATALAGLVIVLVGATLLEYLFDKDLGIDQLVVSGQPGPHPGRMSVAGALCAALLASSRLLSLRGNRRAAELAAGAAGLGAVTVLVGALYDIHSLFAYRPITTLAPPGAIAVLLLSAAALAGVPDGHFVWFLRAPDAGAELVPRLLPFAIVGVPLMGYACLFAERHGILDPSEATVALVAGCALAVAVVAWTAGRRLQRVDRGRLRAIDDLTRLTDDLENQVQRRVAQLQHERAQIAILEERHRIASDLHDIVIQRLFAAGMYLEGAGAMVTDPKARERVDTAVDAMDGAIKDLRAAIFQLNSVGEDAITLHAAITKVGHEASRVLGFMPRVAVHDLDGRAEPARDDILAVVREALANTARHARASCVAIDLTADRDGVELRIEDDGIGIGRPTRASGTANIRDRARRWGGTCVWESVHPHGTRVRWTIPDPIGTDD